MERLQELLASLMTAENTEIIEEIVTLFNASIVTPAEENATEEGVETGEDWEGKYNALKQKFVERFTEGTPATEEETTEEDDTPNEENVTIDDLFEEGK